MAKSSLVVAKSQNEAKLWADSAGLPDAGIRTDHGSIADRKKPLSVFLVLSWDRNPRISGILADLNGLIQKGQKVQLYMPAVYDKKEITVEAVYQCLDARMMDQNGTQP